MSADSTILLNEQISQKTTQFTESTPTNFAQSPNCY